MNRRLTEYGLYSPVYEHDSCGVGCIADVQKCPSHTLVENARSILIGLSHRGALGSEKNTGDGAGILTSMPDAFFRSLKTGKALPEAGAYAAGTVFLPEDETNRNACKDIVNKSIEHYGAKLLFWRRVPVDNSMVGESSLAYEPYMEQVFIERKEDWDGQEFERKLYLIRKYASHAIRGKSADPDAIFYVCSLSAKTIVYKGMLTNDQLFDYYLDLKDENYTAYIALVHSRFATNTFPNWERAHPFRLLCHNGEINTIRGNINYMRAREGVLQSKLYGDDIQDIFPVIESDTADSGNFDNVLEFLHLTGKTLEDAMLLMIPKAWHHDMNMSETRRSWYEFNSCLMEPWDGPAAILSCNGDSFTAMLDRNGLRPVRYYHTVDDQIIMSSEAGVLPIAPERIKHKGRLQSGKIFLIDFNKKQVINGDEREEEIASKNPYGDWLSANRLTLADLALPKDYPKDNPQNHSGQHIDDIISYARAFGHTEEHIQTMLKPICEAGKEPIGSMGNDAPLAVFSDIPRLQFDYFHQLFAQVTNPPIDSIRERLFMSLCSYIGPQKNLLEPQPEHARRLYLEHPVLTDEECERIIAMDHKGWKSCSIDISYPITDAPKGLRGELDRICAEADAAIENAYKLIVLSDKAVSATRISIGALLACATIHHHLVRGAKRTQIGIVVQTGEAREVHHFCCLVGYGADAVHPYIAFQLMEHLSQTKALTEQIDKQTIEERYLNALAYGMRKVFGKMGISTLESYKFAQIFEIVGFSPAVVDHSFTGTASRVGGIGYDDLAEEMMNWHHLAFAANKQDSLNFGEYQWRVNQETHMWDPKSISLIRNASRYNDYTTYKEFSSYINDHLVSRATLRGSLEFANAKAIPIETVEPVESIMKRFVTGAMSFGSISIEAHETLAIAMNRIGGKSNTGEGGENNERYTPLPNGDSRRSAIKQVASGRFGVNIEYLSNADEIQIKMAQGAKPGEGGELPGQKVFPAIAKTRYSIPGVGLISPPPHHDIYSIEDLAQLIFDLKNANPSARISVKLVSEVGVGTVAAGVAKAHADHILISGYEGGTGASALTGIKHGGVPWELGISEVHQTLVMNDLRSRVTLQTDGQLKTGRDVVMAALLGAEECGFATAPLITLGCIMMRKCEQNTCPVGIATQNKTLRDKFDGKPEYVVNFMRFVAQETREIMAELGFTTFSDMVGKVSHLRFHQEKLPKKSKGMNLEKLLTPPLLKHDNVQTHCCVEQDHGIDKVIDRSFIQELNKAIDEGRFPIADNGKNGANGAENADPAFSPSFTIEKHISNRDRTIGSLLSHELYKRFGLHGLSPESIGITLQGSAGQSFGAWLIQGIRLTLYGDANDYPGKGLSGGSIVIRPHLASTFEARDNIIVGNVAFYGATMGKAFICGRAAERFCVRNSGAQVVVEGVGDHGCEYMTGGRVVIIGPIGRNFAAGMSGGIAYLYHPQRDLSKLINAESVIICDVDEDDEKTIHAMLMEHHAYTDSKHAKTILNTWDRQKSDFVKVISPEYKSILELQQRNTEKELVHG